MPDTPGPTKQLHVTYWSQRVPMTHCSSSTMNAEPPLNPHRGEQLPTDSNRSTAQSKITTGRAYGPHHCFERQPAHRPQPATTHPLQSAAGAFGAKGVEFSPDRRLAIGVVSTDGGSTRCDSSNQDPNRHAP